MYVNTSAFKQFTAIEHKLQSSRMFLFSQHWNSGRNEYREHLARVCSGTGSLDVTSTVNTSHMFVQVAFILTRLRTERTAEDFDVTDAMNDRQVTL